MLTPTEVFPGYTYNSNTDVLSIPIADIPVFSEPEANATTGDVRELIRGILEKAAGVIDAMPAADRPRYITIVRGNVVGVSPTIIRRSYTVTFEEVVSPVSTTLRAEPV